jgi:hypothetical protein
VVVGSISMLWKLSMVQVFLAKLTGEAKISRGRAADKKDNFMLV